HRLDARGASDQARPRHRGAAPRRGSHAGPAHRGGRGRRGRVRSSDPPALAVIAWWLARRLARIFRMTHRGLALTVIASLLLGACASTPPSRQVRSEFEDIPVPKGLAYQ